MTDLGSLVQGANYQQESSFMSQEMQNNTNNNIEDERENSNLFRRMKALKNIFNIYSKQHIPFKEIGFEQMEDLSSRIILGDFHKFCKDFGLTKDLGFTREKMTKIFHKVGECHKPILYHQFISKLFYFLILYRLFTNYRRRVAPLQNKSS